jgi:hypothetical protein
MRAIEGLPGRADAFAGWDYPDDLDMDRMFLAEGPLPRVFEAALAATGDALDAFRARARADGFALVALAGESLSTRSGPGAVESGRRMWDRGGLHRLRQLASARGIPLLDLYDFIVARGGAVRDAHFRRDGHWSAQGHRWVAEMLLERFAAEPALCPPRPPAAARLDYLPRRVGPRRQIAADAGAEGLPWTTPRTSRSTSPGSSWFAARSANARFAPVAARSTPPARPRVCSDCGRRAARPSATCSSTRRWSPI